MLILTEPPEKSHGAMRDYYRRLHAEGLTFSAPIQSARYDMSADYDPAWAADSIAWNADGKEAYRFADGRQVTLKSGGALTIAGGERYAYETLTDARFRTNMIVFSASLARSIGQSMTLAQVLAQDEGENDRLPFKLASHLLAASLRH